MESLPGWISALPTINALFNTSSAVLMLLGYRFIRAGRIDAHKRCMAAALTASALFLCGYLTYHWHAGTTTFGHEGEFVRTVYLTILLTHTVLAIIVTPLVLATVTLALRDRLPRHRRLARITLPIWLYVSVTGVVIYVMLYHLPGAAG